MELPSLIAGSPRSPRLLPPYEARAIEQLRLRCANDLVLDGAFRDRDAATRAVLTAAAATRQHAYGVTGVRRPDDGDSLRQDTPAHVVDDVPDAGDPPCRHDALADCRVLTTRRRLRQRNARYTDAHDVVRGRPSYGPVSSVRRVGVVSQKRKQRG